MIAERLADLFGVRMAFSRRCPPFDGGNLARLVVSGGRWFVLMVLSDSKGGLVTLSADCYKPANQRFKGDAVRAWLLLLAC